MQSHYFHLSSGLIDMIGSNADAQRLNDELARLRAENERLKAAANALDLDDIEWALNASARQFSDEFTPMRMKIVQRTLMRVRSLRAAMTTPTAPPAR